MAKKKGIRYVGPLVPTLPAHIPSEVATQESWHEMYEMYDIVIQRYSENLNRGNPLVIQKESLLESEKDYVEGNDPVLDRLLSILQYKDTYILDIYKKGSFYELGIGTRIPQDKNYLWECLKLVTTVLLLTISGWFLIWYLFYFIVPVWVVILTVLISLYVFYEDIQSEFSPGIPLFYKYYDISKKELKLIKTFYEQLDKNEEEEKEWCELWDKSYKDYSIPLKK